LIFTVQLSRWDTCIFIRADLPCITLDVSQFYVEKVIELCEIQVNVSDAHFIVICIYGSSTRNLNQFLNLVDAALKHKPKMEFLLCGDLYVNSLIHSNCKLELSMLLQTYNMPDSVDFPTRIHNTSIAAVDSIFIDYTRINSFEISPLINGLFDHDTKHLILTSVFAMYRGVSIAYRTCLITKDLISTFLDTLSSESWKNVYEHAENNKTYFKYIFIYL
jgi:hypothetical protein